MKTKMLLCLLGIISPLFADASPSDLILQGETIRYEETRAVGDALVIVESLSLRVSADAISFDRGKRLLKCDGEVTVRTASGVVRSKDCVIELPTGERRVVFSAKRKEQEESKGRVLRRVI
jgi:hypothetical protein